MKIIIFGPQGSGKGTQAELIARRYGLPYISTGDIFRFQTKNQTALGQKVNTYISRGDLVPDQLTNEIIKDRLQQPDCTVGFVLDGYPRNKIQLDFLDQVTGADFVIVIDLSDQTAIERLSGRLACKCGLSYHLKFNPPKKEGICDRCGNQLFRRDDDKPEAIKKRLDIYHLQTEPLFAIYEAKGILYHVNGGGLIEEVYEQINKIISKK